MKQFLLLILTFAFFTNIHSQKYWQAEEYPEWDRVYENHLVSFVSDITNNVTGLSGLTDFESSYITIANASDKENAIWQSNEPSYFLRRAQEDQLVVDFDRTQGAEEEWRHFMLEFTQWTAPRPDNLSPNFEAHSRYGYVVDMRENFRINGEIFIPEDFKVPEGESGFAVRVSVTDSHGHEWNHGGDPIDTIYPSQFGKWASFEIDYPKLSEENPEGKGWEEHQHGDKWSESFYGVKKPVSLIDTFVVPIDTAHISGLRIYFMPGHDVTFKNEIKLRKLNIGDGSEKFISWQTPNPITDKYWIPEEYVIWDAFANKYLAETDTHNTTYCTGLYNLTDFTNEYNIVSNSPDEDAVWSTGSPSYELNTSLGNMLSVYFYRSKADGTKWHNFRVDFTKWLKEIPELNSSNMRDFPQGGYVVDMRENFEITGEIYISDDMSPSPITGGFTLRASVLDIHGHEWNYGGDPTDTIPASEFGNNNWYKFRINYPELAEKYPGRGWNLEFHGDMYSEIFNNMRRPFDHSVDKHVAPIDTAQIGGIVFYFNPGESANYDGKVKFRNIQIGDGSTAFSPQSSELQVSVNTKNASFKDVNNGAIHISITGGVKPYDIYWGDNVKSEDRVGILPGDYYLEVEDNYRGKSKQTITVGYDKSGNNSIAGTIYANEKGAQATVWLFYKEEITFPAVSTQTNSAGEFSFKNLPLGEYAVYAIPSEDNAGFTPTFYRSSHTCLNALPLHIEESTTEYSHININLLPLKESTKGGHKITGTVIIKDNSLIQAGIFNPSTVYQENEDNEVFIYASNYPVYLKHNGEIIAWSQTDESGNFSFNDLVLNNYEIEIEKHNQFSHSEYITEEDFTEEESNVTITIDSKSINNTTQVSTIPSPFNIYPNPFSNILTINGNDFINAEIYTIEGRLIYSSTKKEFSTSSLPKGAYILSVKTNNKAFNHMIIKE